MARARKLAATVWVLLLLAWAPAAHAERSEAFYRFQHEICREFTRFDKHSQQPNQRLDEHLLDGNGHVTTDPDELEKAGVAGMRAVRVNFRSYRRFIRPLQPPERWLRHPWTQFKHAQVQLLQVIKRNFREHLLTPDRAAFIRYYRHHVRPVQQRRDRIFSKRMHMYC